jgi:hypothetical protein
LARLVAHIRIIEDVAAEPIAATACRRKHISAILRIAGTVKQLRAFYIRLHDILPFSQRGVVAQIELQHSFIVVLRVLHYTQANLLQVTLATGTAGIFASARKHREQDRRQYYDYGYNYRQFDEREGCALRAGVNGSKLGGSLFGYLMHSNRP